MSRTPPAASGAGTRGRIPAPARGDAQPARTCPETKTTTPQIAHKPIDKPASFIETRTRRRSRWWCPTAIRLSAAAHAEASSAHARRVPSSRHPCTPPLIATRPTRAPNSRRTSTRHRLCASIPTKPAFLALSAKATLPLSVAPLRFAAPVGPKVTLHTAYTDQNQCRA